MFSHHQTNRPRRCLLLCCQSAGEVLAVVAPQPLYDDLRICDIFPIPGDPRGFVLRSSRFLVVQLERKTYPGN